MGKNTSPDTAQASPALVEALRRLLKPLLRLLIHRGFGYPQLAEMLKGLFVEVADESFRLPGKTQTDSRISLLTGVHRKDVKRLRESGEDAAGKKSAPPLSAQLIARWTGDAHYLDENGAPRPLARLASQDPSRSFEALVQGSSKDIRPRAVLDEWLRQGLARLDEDDQVHLLTAAFLPEEGREEKAYYFGRNLHDHMAAGVHNLLGATPPLLERNVYYDQLSPDAVDELARLSREHGMEALQVINRAALNLQERDHGKAEANQRMSFGIYFFRPPTDPGDKDD